MQCSPGVSDCHTERKSAVRPFEVRFQGWQALGRIVLCYSKATETDVVQRLGVLVRHLLKRLITLSSSHNTSRQVCKVSAPSPAALVLARASGLVRSDSLSGTQSTAWRQTASQDALTEHLRWACPVILSIAPRRAKISSLSRFGGAIGRHQGRR